MFANVLYPLARHEPAFVAPLALACKVLQRQDGLARPACHTTSPPQKAGPGNLGASGSGAKGWKALPTSTNPLQSHRVPGSERVGIPVMEHNPRTPP